MSEGRWAQILTVAKNRAVQFLPVEPFAHGHSCSERKFYQWFVGRLIWWKAKNGYSLAARTSVTMPRIPRVLIRVANVASGHKYYELGASGYSLAILTAGG
jgi:hypothetical protein